MMIGSGIEYIQHNERLTLTESQTDNIETFEQSDVPNEFLSQEGFLTKNTSFIYQNQHRLFNIPVNISWLLKSNKIRLAPTVGLVINVLQKSTGEIENREGIATDLNPHFKTNVGLAYRLGCKFLYPLNSRVSLYANPQFELNTSELSTIQNPISQRRNFVKLDIGISRSFL